MTLFKAFSLFSKVSLTAIAASLLLTLTAYADNESRDEVHQSLQFGLGQQRQVFSFESQNLEMDVVSQALQYQYSRADWLFGAAFSRNGAEQEGKGDKAYDLTFSGRTLFIFAEKAFSDFWLGVGASQGSDDSQYKIMRSHASGEISDNTDFRNLSLDMGYGQFLSSSYWSLGAGLTQQWLSTAKKLNLQRNAKPVTAQNSETTEQALLAGLSARYEHYFTLTKRYELALSGAINHQLTLSGDGRIQLSQQRRGPAGVQQKQLSKEIKQSSSSSTALSVRMTMLFSRYSVSAEIDQLTDQSAADAYYGVNLGTNF